MKLSTRLGHTLFLGLLLASTQIQGQTPSGSIHGMSVCDSLLMVSSFDQAQEAMAKMTITPEQQSAYLKLIGEIQYILNSGDAALQKYCKSGLPYKEKFIASFAGIQAAQHYARFERLLAENRLGEAAIALKIASFYKLQNIQKIYAATTSMIDSSEALFKRGDFKPAIAQMESIREDLYKYLIFKDRRWNYEARLEKYREAQSNLENEQSLKDTSFVWQKQREIAIITDYQFLSAPLEFPRAVFKSHSTMTSYHSSFYINDFTSQAGVGLGLEYSWNFIRPLAVQIKALAGRVYYSGKNDSTGSDINLNSKNRSISLGLRGNLKQKGRVNYFGSIYLTRQYTETIGKIIDRHPYIESEYYLIDSSKGEDTQVEYKVGVSYFSLAKAEMEMRIALGYRQLIGSANYYGPHALVFSFSTGYRF